MRVTALLLSLFAIVGPLHAATITANSTSATDVQAAVNASVTGDSVFVPKGQSIWTQSVLINGKGIKLIGAGTNSTTGSVLVDENPHDRINQPSLFDVIWQGTNGGMFEMYGFQFKGSSNQTTNAISGMIRLKASNNMTNDSVWRIHDCWFNDPYARPMLVRAWSGLMDRNAFSLTHHLAGIAFDNRIAAGEYGDRAWAQEVPWGTTNLLYFEHNFIDSTGSPRAITDGFAGVRYVARFNTVRNRSFENHGTESTQRPRSTRYMEVYGNVMTQDGGTGEYATLLRGGGGLIFSNRLIGPWPGLLRSFYALSLQSHSPWGMANGTNVWDLNFAGGPFQSGTHTGTNGSPVLVDKTKNWSANQWVGYSVINYSQTFTNPPGVQNKAGLITANTATTITYFPTDIPIEVLNWKNGDVYRIWRVLKGLDAMGRGKGTLTTGGSSATPPTPIGFPNERDDPVRLWANIGPSTVAVGAYPLFEGRDWTNSPPTGYVPLVDPHPLAGGQIIILPATKLAFSQQPTTTVQASSIQPPLTVLIEDVNGTLVNSSASVTIAIGANPGSGILSGILTHAAVNGVATFSGLSINNTGTNYTLAASSAGLTSATSIGFDIVSSIGPPAKLLIQQQPVITRSGVPISPALTVTIADTNGTQTASTANVTVAIGSNPAGGVLSGTLVRAAVAGLATFDDLQISKAGTYTLVFTSGILTSATSVSFTVTSPTLSFEQQPTTTGQSVIIQPPVTVRINNGNIDDESASVTIAIGTNPGAGTLSGTLTQTAAFGVATFDDLSINNTGTNYTLTVSSSGMTGATSLGFDVVTAIAPPAKLLIAQQPTSTLSSAIMVPPITVKIADATGAQTDSTANVTVAIGSNPAGGILSGTLTRAAVSGLATFDDLQISNVGTYTLVFTSGILTPDTSASFPITSPVPPNTPPTGASKLNLLILP